MWLFIKNQIWSFLKKKFQKNKKSSLADNFTYDQVISEFDKNFFENIKKQKNKFPYKFDDETYIKVLKNFNMNSDQFKKYVLECYDVVGLELDSQQSIYDSFDLNILSSFSMQSNFWYAVCLCISFFIGFGLADFLAIFGIDINLPESPRGRRRILNIFLFFFISCAGPLALEEFVRYLGKKINMKDEDIDYILGTRKTKEKDIDSPDDIT